MSVPLIKQEEYIDHQTGRLETRKLWRVMDFTPRESKIYVEEEQTFITRKISTHYFFKEEIIRFKNDIIK